MPPTALSIHLAIGEAYAFNVFNEPLTRVIGIKQPAPAIGNSPRSAGSSAWRWFLWVYRPPSSESGSNESVRARQCLSPSACCFSGGFLISAVGVRVHQVVLLYLGYGVLGGIGLGLGYISPVSTLIKWFPDRPGMATGMAIMGFGGGAMIGGPLAVRLMNFFASSTSTGVVETFVVMGAGYFLFMLFGAATVRLPPPGWKPGGLVPSDRSRKLVTSANVTADEAIMTPQFYLLWTILFLNVTAGIGILGRRRSWFRKCSKGIR